MLSTAQIKTLKNIQEASRQHFATKTDEVHASTVAALERRGLVEITTGLGGCRGSGTSQFHQRASMLNVELTEKARATLAKIEAVLKEMDNG